MYALVMSSTIRFTTGTITCRRRTTEYASHRHRITGPATLTTSIQVWVGVPAASKNAPNWTRYFLSGPTYMAHRHRRTRGSSCTTTRRRRRRRRSSSGEKPGMTPGRRSNGGRCGEGKESNIVQLARRLTTTQRLLPIFAPHLHRPVVPAGPAVAQLLERVELARVHEVGDDHGS